MLSLRGHSKVPRCRIWFDLHHKNYVKNDLVKRLLKCTAPLRKRLNFNGINLRNQSWFNLITEKYVGPNLRRLFNLIQRLITEYAVSGHISNAEVLILHKLATF
jgi:hypothetical protein